MTINLHRWSKLDEKTKKRFLTRSEEDITEITEAVAAIIAQVRQEGDKALQRMNAQFDKAPPRMPIRVPKEHFQEAEESLPNDVKEALAFSLENVRRYHEDQEPDGLQWKEIRPGVLAGERTRAIDSAGFYIPRSRGSFPSMLYMMAIPARIARVKRLAMASPPDASGRVDPACLYTAHLCGIEEVYALGGAQAWAAFAYGSGTVTKVDKCLGPGSKYVAAAKRLLGDVLDCGLPAGPSESIILADTSPDARLVAQDLMVEAEHGSDSSAILITPSAELANNVKNYLTQMIPALPEPRRQFVNDVFQGYGGIFLVDTMPEAIELTNLFACEHLQIRTTDPFFTLHAIKHAGEILLGEHTPFSVANYSVGANAVLPTGGRARTWSGVSVRDFKKRSSLVYLSQEGFETLRGQAAILARYEGFPAHEKALNDR